MDDGAENRESSGQQAMPSAGGRATVFILFAVLLDTIGFGIIAPVMPELIMELTGEGISQAARYGGWLLFVYAVMQLFFAPVLGNLSDRFGRRPVLLISLAAFGCDYIVMGFAPTLAWLFAARVLVLAGIFGATHSTANAFIADISAPEGRAKNFGLIGATWGVGFMIGPVIGGLLGEFGPRIPFFVAAALSLLNVAYGFLVLPETLREENRRPFVWTRANPIGALAQMRRYPIVVGLFAATVFYQIAHDANPSIWSFYTMLKFDWSPRDVGLSLGAVGLAMAVVQAGLVEYALKHCGERNAVIGGYFLMAAAYFGFAYASEGWMMYALMLPFALGSIVSPAIRGILANQVPANAQGELQGALSSLMSLTAIIGPLFMTQLFGFFASDAAPIYFPGAPYFAAGVLVLVAIAVFQRVTSRMTEPAWPHTKPETTGSAGSLPSITTPNSSGIALNRIVVASRRL